MRCSHDDRHDHQFLIAIIVIIIIIVIPLRTPDRTWNGGKFTEGFYALFAKVSTIAFGYADYAPSWNLLIKANTEESLHFKSWLSQVLLQLLAWQHLSVVSRVMFSPLEAI